ncbi:MAG: peptidylprolyl isomerase [Phycisphaerae bacterium]
MLEQLIVLDEAERAAARRGLYITDKDVEREYETALLLLTNPLASVTTGEVDKEIAERALNRVLAERNVSREEFMLGIRRRAYLKKLVESEMQFTQQQLQAEMQRLYGERIRVRHIQLAVPRHIQRMKSQLAAGGNFAMLAQQHSANLLSAKDGGLLQPFSASEEGVPEAFRRTAFALQPGEVSNPIRVGEWYHLIKLEERLPAIQKNLETARPELEASLRDRTLEPAIQKKYESLLRNARITIDDPVLEAAFEAVQPR